MRRAVALALAGCLLGSSLGALSPQEQGEPSLSDPVSPAVPGPDQSKPGLPGPDQDLRTIPETAETEALPAPSSPKDQRIESTAALAGILGGMVLSAFGISLFFRGAGDGLDTQTMHQGLGIALSGSLIAAFCAVFRSPRDSSPE